MTTKLKDQAVRYAEGTLPENPEDDAHPVGEDGKIAHDPFTGRWLTLSAEQLADPPPKRRPLLTRYVDGRDIDLLLRGKAGLLAAGGGTGKTQLLCQLALSVALGKHFLGFNVPEAGHVLLALAEEDTEEVQRRLWRAANAMELSREERREAAARIVAAPLAGIPVALVESDAKGNPTDSDTLRALQRRLEDATHDWALVVLDPLSRWGSADAEKDNAAATRLVQAVESLVTVRGKPTVLVAHHSSKDSLEKGAANVRGVTGIQDGFRWVATLTQAGSRGVQLANPKSNYSMRFDPVWLARDSEQGKEGTLRLASDTEAKEFEQAARQGDADTEAKKADAALLRARTGAKKAGIPAEPDYFPKDKKP